MYQIDATHTAVLYANCPRPGASGGPPGAACAARLPFGADAVTGAHAREAKRCIRPLVLVAFIAAGICLGPGMAAGDGPALGVYPGYTGPAFDGFTVESHYVTMRDGVKLAVDVMLPKGLREGERVPALLHLTRFWRSVSVRWPFSYLYKPREDHLFFVNHGYAIVLVDVRGTGASFGSQVHPWHKAEREDYAELAAWTAAQPWCDGNLAAVGMGYEATAGEFLAAQGLPEVKAVISRFNEWDSFTETAFPGGIMNDMFIRRWARVNRLMDRNLIPSEIGILAQVAARGVRPVDGSEDLLDDALRDHLDNEDLYELALEATSRDTVVARPGRSGTLDDFSLHTMGGAISGSGTPLVVWGGWYDAGSALGVLRRLNTLDNPVRAVIGPWNKGATQNASPLAKSSPPTLSPEAQRLEMLRFLDHHLKGIDVGEMPRTVLHFYSMGAETWRITREWPLPGVEAVRAYLAPDNRLSDAPPAAESGVDTYTVDFDATTGLANRWHTHLLGDDVSYGDRGRQARRMLVYTGSPLEAPIELSGTPVVTLHLACSLPDAAVYAYLEAVPPRGNVLYVTEGQLRLLHRAESSEPPPYWSDAPYHTFRESDAQPVTPGEVMTIRFGMFPTSIVIPAGHRLRLSIAGHDADTFRRIPEEGVPAFTIHRTAGMPSHIALPVAGPR